MEVTNWLLHIDSSSTLAGSGAGVVLTSPEGDELAYALHFDFKASNKEAEYEALIAGIKMALDAGARNLISYVDSQLVTKQVEGEYEVKEKRMKKYLQEIGELTSRLRNFQLHQIPTTENTKADYLARLASSLVDYNTHSITIKTFVKNSLKLDIAILQVDKFEDIRIGDLEANGIDLHVI
ncbi:UNVERIFIED_CONTAM: Ribonuclease HI [Sesamum radiatum]|uniref:Ribonuclease HI n=1 Tax=Sesamum radiatum TaxID=300843 RepID=A0AAW2U8U5_SESRA